MRTAATAARVTPSKRAYGVYVTESTHASMLVQRPGLGGMCRPYQWL